MLHELNSGWPASKTRRARKPAGEKPADPRTTVKPTPRGKYGLPPRTERVKQPRQEELISSRAPRLTYIDFYQQINSGTWPSLARAQDRQRLFATSNGTGVVSPALRRKVCPAFNTTGNWTRLQRKVLPKYLFVLDDVAGVLLLKALVRLQPPALCVIPSIDGMGRGQQRIAYGGDADDSSTATLPGQQQQQQQKQQQQVRQAARPQLRATEVPSSITGAIRSRHAAATGAGQHSLDVAAMDAAAVARGFACAADERSQFEQMLAAVYTAFQHRLEQWDGRRLMKAVGLVAQLQMQHEGFMQCWFAATASHLAQQQMPYLAVCLEGLASLQCPPPEAWCNSFTAASQGHLDQLSLQQLAMLLMHISDLQLQLPDAWWQEFGSCVLVHAAGQLDFRSRSTLGASAAWTAPEAAEGLQQQQQQHKQVQQELQQELQQQPPRAERQQAAAALEAAAAGAEVQYVVLSRPAVDALCSMLWVCCQLPGQPMQQAWLSTCVDLLLPALQANRCSAGGAVQLLQACSSGACSQLLAAGQVRGACLLFLQRRLSKVCGQAGTLKLLVTCLLVPVVQQQLPAGFCEDLEEGLAPVLMDLPTHLLVDVARVFSSCQHRPGVQLMSGFVLATANRLSGMSGREISAVVSSCEGMGAAMPTVWVGSVLQQLQQRGLAVRVGEDAAAFDAGDVGEVLSVLPRIASSWGAVQAAYKSSVDYLYCG